MIARVAFWLMAICWALFFIIIFTYPTWAQNYQWNEYRYDSQGNYETWTNYQYDDGSTYSWGVRRGPSTGYMNQYERRYVPEDPRINDNRWGNNKPYHKKRW